MARKLMSKEVIRYQDYALSCRQYRVMNKKGTYELWIFASNELTPNDDHWKELFRFTVPADLFNNQNLADPKARIPVKK